MRTIGTYIQCNRVRQRLIARDADDLDEISNVRNCCSDAVNPVVADPAIRWCRGFRPSWRCQTNLDLIRAHEFGHRDLDEVELSSQRCPRGWHGSIRLVPCR